MDVIYVGPLFDSSGYSEASRNLVLALDQAGINVYAVPISFEENKTSFGKAGERVKVLTKNHHNGLVQILHCTPENFPRYIKKDKINIGYTVWETSRLPDTWPDLINKLDEVWVPSKHNVQVFKESGVTIPIKLVPHAFHDKFYTDFSPVQISGVSNDTFVFYSIFQWLPRKNPQGLIKAYLSEFNGVEDVALILKTFNLQPGNPQGLKEIGDEIRNIKARMYLRKSPKILLVTQLLPKEQMTYLHKRGNCYISLHRGEGVGLPILEAMLSNKETIATTYGGPEDFMTKENSHPISYNLTPVNDMPWEIYTGNQYWAEPNIPEAKAAMRQVYTEWKNDTTRKLNAKEDILNKYSFEKVGAILKQEIERLYAKPCNIR